MMERPASVAEVRPGSRGYRMRRAHAALRRLAKVTPHAAPLRCHGQMFLLQS